MAHPIEHAKSSAKKYGGKAEDYLPLHKWFDESKSMVADFRHRSLRHHSEGIFLLENRPTTRDCAQIFKTRRDSK